METVTTAALERFLQELGERVSSPASIYLLGGSALCLLGSPRETLDVDYSLEPGAPEIKKAVETLAAELKMDVEAVLLAEFIPLPPEAQQRRRFIGQYGQLEAYIFDLYSIALSKIARGFEADLEDVKFLLERNLIDLGELELHFKQILPRVAETDIDPRDFQAYFNELKRRVK